MERRKFLQILGGSAVSLYAFDLDKLLWVPGAKTIILPPEKRLIYASEVAAAEWDHFLGVMKETYLSDNLLYKIVTDNPSYKHETGDWRTVQVYYGYTK